VPPRSQQSGSIFSASNQSTQGNSTTTGSTQYQGVTGRQPPSSAI
jgi:hypothetical protein